MNKMNKLFIEQCLVVCDVGNFLERLDLFKQSRMEKIYFLIRDEFLCLTY